MNWWINENYKITNYFLMKYLKLFIFLGYTNAGRKYSWSDYLDL